MMIKKTTISLLMALALNTAAHAETQWLDRIVAIAGKHSITEHELDAEYLMVARELRARGSAIEQSDALRNQVLERLVLKKLQLQAAERAGLRVDDTTLDNSVNRIASENNMSITRFRVALNSEGIDYDEFRQNIHDELMISQLRERRASKQVNVTEQEIDDVIAANVNTGNTEVHLAQILVALPEAASPEQIERAQKEAAILQRQASEGASFEQLAINNSDGQNALKGGDLGWRPNKQLPSVFIAPVSALQPGGISEPIRSPSGYHIVKLIDVRGDNSTPTVEQNRSRHILLTSADGEQRLNDIRRQINAGANFSELASQYSQDPGSAKKGGDLGWNVPGTFVTEFEQAISQLSNGAVSPPFRTQYGWHIVQVIDRRSAAIPDNLMRARAKEMLANQRRDSDTQRWLQQLRDESFVEFRDPSLKGNSE